MMRKKGTIGTMTSSVDLRPVGERERVGSKERGGKINTHDVIWVRLKTRETKNLGKKIQA